MQNQTEKLQEAQSKGFFHSLRQKIWKYRIYLLGLAVVLLAYVVIFAVKGYWPFGSKMLVAGDTLWQYIPFLSALRQKLATGESLAYSWSGSIGANFYYLFAYYLSSPLSLLLLFFPITVVYRIINITVVIKALLAYTTMCLYLVRRPASRFTRNSLPVLFFSVAYVFCNAFITYITFYPYLDCIVLLPLVLLGLERFVANGGFKLYFVSLALMLICNFYLGFMCCLFIILYYLTLQFANFRTFLRKSVQILLLSITSVGVSSYLCVPVVCELSNGAYGISEFTGVGFFTNWFDIVQELLFYTRPVFSGQSAQTWWEANLYMGIAALVLALAYFGNRRIPWLTRVRKAVLLLILALSFNESLINYIFHLLHYTHGQPNRQAIFFVFVCLSLGQETLGDLLVDVKNVSRWKLGVIGVIVLALIILTMLFSSDMGSPYKYLYTMDFVLAYIAILLLQGRFRSQRTFVVTLITLATVEVLVAALHAFPGTSTHTLQQLLQMYTGVQQAVDEVEQEDDSFYHIATNNMTEIDNYGYLGNYRGMNAFLSTCNVDYITQLRWFGVVTDSSGQLSDYTLNPMLYSLFNIKYIFNNTEDTEETQNGLALGNDSMSQYRLVSERQSIQIYANDTALSPVIAAATDFASYEQTLADTDDNSTVHFGELQNAFLSALCGVDSVFSDADIEIEEVSTQNCRAGVTDELFILNNAGGSNEDTDQTYDSTKNSYVTVKAKANEDCDLYTKMLLVDHIGEVKKGEEFTYTFAVQPEIFGDMGIYMQNFTFQKFNADVWESAYETLKSQQMQVTDWSDTSLSGTLTTSEKRTVFTSIPYDPNWSVTVDGKAVSTKAIANGAFLSFSVDAGDHQIQLQYKQKGVAAGVALSIVCIGVFVALCVYTRKKNAQSTDNAVQE